MCCLRAKPLRKGVEILLDAHGDGFRSLCLLNQSSWRGSAKPVAFLTRSTFAVAACFAIRKAAFGALTQPNSAVFGGLCRVTRDTGVQVGFPRLQNAGGVHGDQRKIPIDRREPAGTGGVNEMDTSCPIAAGIDSHPLTPNPSSCRSHAERTRLILPH